MKLTVEIGDNGYDIIIGRNILKDAGRYFNLNRKVAIITDTGVPDEYGRLVMNACKAGYIYSIPQGEKSKNLDIVRDVLSFMVREEFSRKDAVVAVGGGVVGDLAGFAASIYMRGIDFYNVPTTILSQVDSSIGGKVAVDFEGYKNLVGAFYQPKGVLIDVDTLSTLSDRQRVNGLIEALKTGVIGDKKLFEIFESGDIDANIEDIISRSLSVKKSVVEQDPKENGIRKILNFGHTVGHGIEAVSGTLLHGECVAAGMLYMCTDDIRERLLKIYDRLGIRKVISEYITNLTKDEEERILLAMRHDKKADSGRCSAVITRDIGSCEIVDRNLGDIFPGGEMNL